MALESAERSAGEAISNQRSWGCQRWEVIWLRRNSRLERKPSVKTGTKKRRPMVELNSSPRKAVAAVASTKTPRAAATQLRNWRPAVSCRLDRAV